MEINNSKSTFTPPHSLNTAVLFLVFNRLDTTKQVFEAIRQAKPPRLYVAADGARETKEGEVEKVKAVRDYIISNIDWECEVKTLFREQNFGCKMAVSGAITWFFENEEMGIILEDDCLPSQSFFWFCEELLEKYKIEPKVSMITGTSYLFNEVLSDNDYFMSKYMSIWGWASWRRVWNKYDIEMKEWPQVKKYNLLNGIFYWDKYVKDTFTASFDLAFDKNINTWDIQFVLKCIMEDTYCITPYKNLISNLGYDGTRSSNSPFLDMRRVELSSCGDLQYDLPVMHDLAIDKILFRNIFYRFKKFKPLSLLLIKLGLYEKVKRIVGIR